MEFAVTAAALGCGGALAAPRWCVLSVERQTKLKTCIGPIDSRVAHELRSFSVLIQEPMRIRADARVSDHELEILQALLLYFPHRFKLLCCFALQDTQAAQQQLISTQQQRIAIEEENSRARAASHAGAASSAAAEGESTAALHAQLAAATVQRQSDQTKLHEQAMRLQELQQQLAMAESELQAARMRLQQQVQRALN